MLFSLNSEGNGHFCPHQREVTPSKNVYFFYQDGNVKMVCLLIVASEWVLTGENGLSSKYIHNDINFTDLIQRFLNGKAAIPSICMVSLQYLRGLTLGDSLFFAMCYIFASRHQTDGPTLKSIITSIIMLTHENSIHVLHYVSL